MGSEPTKNNIIIGFTQMDRAMGGGKTEAVASASQEKFVQDGATPDEATALSFQIAGALKALEKEEAKASPRVMSSPQHPFASALQSYVAEQAASSGKVQPLPLGYEAQFDTKDWLGWAGSFFTWSRKFLQGKHPLPQPMSIGTLPDSVHFAVLADWGTGLYGAPICAQTIANNSLNYQVLLHLGDVYYAGLESEEKNRLLRYWPSLPNAKSYSLNSNHEMYTGGYGYFDALLQDANFKPNQSSSYFALQNSNFLFLFLDTAYVEHDFVQDERGWLVDAIAKAADRKIILFSHHQLFSRLDVQGPNLRSVLAEALQRKRIFAWYWGHEHRCVVYDQDSATGLFARCVGHSGMPYERGDVAGLPFAAGQQPCWKQLSSTPDASASMVLDGPNKYIDPSDNPDRYGPNGYLSLLAEGTHLTEIIHDPEGKTLYQKDLC
jgi:Calcineurin-like phosphoesterase